MCCLHNAFDVFCWIKRIEEDRERKSGKDGIKDGEKGEGRERERGRKERGRKKEEGKGKVRKRD